jgi:gamma-glutamylcyclotransferase (GGCT)/AIG2-like uncharacterized protein YtfP
VITSTPPLFVYGTLRAAFGHEMHRRLERELRFIGYATVHGVLYDLGAYPALVLDAAEGGPVRGEVYALDADRAAAALAALDAYEGCASADPQPHEYRREILRATLDDGRTLAAWAWLLNRPHAGCTRIPGGDYLAWRRGGGK